MRTPSTIRRLLAGILVWGLVALAWFCFAPPALGGWTNYVTTDGISMEPHFHGGDLVLVRAETNYRVGQIVAYRSKALGTVVLHRIIGRDGSRYIFKGDNNNFTDIEHPARSQLVGALWLHVPGKYARVLNVLREPPVLGGLVSLSALLLGGGVFTRRRSRRRKRRLDEERMSPARGGFQPGPTVAYADLLIAGIAVLLGSAAVAAVAYSRPVVAPAPTSFAYTQGGAFSYSSSTASGPAYPGGRVVTGDPVFIKLVHDVNMRFAYRFSAGAPHHIAGHASLAAKITSSSGWTRTLELEPSTAFTGDRVVVGGTLALGSLIKVLNGLENTTAVSGNYQLSLIPHVSIAGVIGNVPTHTVFSTPLPFSLDTLELQPVLSSGASTAVATTGTAVNPLDPSSSASVIGTARQPRTLAFGPLKISVGDARDGAAGGLVVAICLLLSGAVFLVRATARQDDGASELLARYRRSLVRVTRAPRPSESELVELGDMETLVRIAERYDRMILHESMMGADTFSVPEDGVLYRYAVPSEVLLKLAPEPAPAAPEQPKITLLLNDLDADLTAAAQNAALRRLVTKRGPDARDVRWGPWKAAGS
jgi:signal peptidase I